MLLPRNPTIIASSRIFVTTARPVVRIMPVASKRAYTMTPSVPQPSEAKEFVKSQDNNNADIHALYNKDNVSMLEVDHHHETQHRSLSDSGEPSDSFSPTFNTVFDE